MSDTKTPAPDLQEQDRTAQGRFVKGQSGNPKGRIKGSKNRATQAALELMGGQLEQITQTLIDAALNGDITAAKIILDKLAPNSREHPLPPLELPQITQPQDLPQLTQAVLESVKNGDLLPSQAAALSSLVTAHARSLELCELEARLAALEAAEQKE